MADERRGLVVRADGGPAIGSGHLARCLALVQAWMDKGGTATLVSDMVPKTWARRYWAEGATLVSTSEWTSGRACATAEWVVLDGYGFSPDYQNRIAARSPRVLVIDDHGQVGHYSAQVVLDQNLDATPAAYLNREPRTELLLGTRFALLRREFAIARRTLPAVPGFAQRLLVSLGGFPSPTVSALFHDVAERLVSAHNMVVHGLEEVEDVPGAMATADVALTASGSTCWELCCMGLPAVLVSVASNQQPLAQAMAVHGAALDAGPVELTDAARLTALVAGLAHDPARRSAMTSAGRALVDGRGARRVVTRLLGHVLHLRRATAADCRLYWEWVNDSLVRASSFSSRPISWNEHQAWFDARLADPTSHLYVAHDDGRQPLGQVRFKVENDRALVSVSVAPEHRGVGWGAAIIDAGTRHLLRECRVAVIEARIRPSNKASRSVFSDAGFIPEDCPNAEHVVWIRYAHRQDAARS